MKVMIGFWLICLAITIFIVSLEPTFDFKEKAKFVCGVMLFLSALMVGLWLMVG